MEKKKLLLKPCWSYKDIMEYLGCKHTKAINIKDMAIKNGGGVKYSTSLAKVDSVLELFGTTREKELSLYEIEVRQEDKEKDL